MAYKNLAIPVWRERIGCLATDLVVKHSSPATDIYVVHCWLINTNKLNLLSWLLANLSDKQSAWHQHLSNNYNTQQLKYLQFFWAVIRVPFYMGIETTRAPKSRQNHCSVVILLIYSAEKIFPEIYFLKWLCVYLF